MGDVRYEKHLTHLLEQGPASLGELHDDELIQALAALAAREGDDRAGYLANVLASEAMNRLRRAHAALMQTDQGILALDPDGAGVFLNPAAEAILGLRPRDLRGVHAHTLLHDDDAHDCPLAQALRGEITLRRARATIHRPDGTPVTLEYSARPITHDGERTGAVLSMSARE